jgi:hypothetical protein
LVGELDAKRHGHRDSGEGRMTVAATNQGTTIGHVRVHTMTEEARWILTLCAPLVIAAASFMAAIATGVTWLIAPAIVAGPGAGVIGFVFLALTSDTNAAAVASTLEAAPSTDAPSVVAEAA